MDILHPHSYVGIQFHGDSTCCCMVVVPEDYSLVGFLNSRGYEHVDTLEQIGDNIYICLIEDLFDF